MSAKQSRETIEKDILVSMRKPGTAYWVGLAFSASLLLFGALCWAYQLLVGMGAAGIRNPTAWGVYITDFVFWVGIAHSGTLISAVLLLFRAKFRSSFNRGAEAMTVIAVMIAGLFPIIHLGRAWFFYWLFPYPNQRLLWVNFRSPLVWDVFAVSTYLTVSVIFFYVGLIPDIAIARRYAKGIRKTIYNLLSLGWQGTEREWQHYQKLTLYLAAFATPLVVSVHSVVSWDFAMSITPGWHATIFAPYFVAGAILSGIAMVFTLSIPIRKIFGIEKYISIDRYESLAKVWMVTSFIVGYAYITEFALAFYSGSVFERETFVYRAFGAYSFLFWLMVFCNVIAPLVLLVKKYRRNLSVLFVLSIFVNIGMWLERFNIVATSLSHSFEPYAWTTYIPSIIEIGITLGSFGMFFTLYLLFIKVLPIISITEHKEEADEE